MAKFALKFLLLAAAVVSAAAADEPNSSRLVEVCSKAIKTPDDKEMNDFCANEFLKGKDDEFTDTNDWEKMSRVVISLGEARAAAVKKTVADMANNKSLGNYDIAMLNLCLQSVAKGADQISSAATKFQDMKKVSDDAMEEVRMLVDNGKSNQDTCDDLLGVQASLSEVKKQVHDAFLASDIVSKFLFEVRAQ